MSLIITTEIPDEEAALLLAHATAEEWADFQREMFAKQVQGIYNREARDSAPAPQTVDASGWTTSAVPSEGEMLGGNTLLWSEGNPLLSADGTPLAWS